MNPSEMATPSSTPLPPPSTASAPSASTASIPAFIVDSPPAATFVHHESDETENPSPDPKVFEKEDEYMFCRSQSETRPPADTEAASARLTKSSDRLETDHPFEEKKAARQPANAVIEEVEHEADARADDFINRLRQQLHL